MNTKLTDFIDNNLKEPISYSNLEYIDVTNISPSDKLTVVSLFSGCGGMDLGFEGDFTIFLE